MKRIIYVALIAAAFMVPTVPQELGKLIPVEVIKIESGNDAVLIETDTGETGRGATVEMALQDLKATAAGTVYLDTAAYVLLPEGEEGLLVSLNPLLKDSVRVCCWEGAIKMEEVASYLAVHRPKTELKRNKRGMELPTLTTENGRLILKEKSRKKMKIVLDKGGLLC